jgi:hypothetical protein
MLLFSPFFGFLILVTITTISHAVPKDIHIYLHGLGKSANNPKMIYPPFDDNTPPMEAAIAETNTEATEGSNRQWDFDDNDCNHPRKNQMIRMFPPDYPKSPCSNNSPKFPPIMPILKPIP